MGQTFINQQNCKFGSRLLGAKNFYKNKPRTACGYDIRIFLENKQIRTISGGEQQTNISTHDSAT